MAIAEAPKTRPAAASREPLRLERHFTREGTHPYDEISWERRDAIISGEHGPVFEEKDVEVPSFWSQTATNVVASKYFRGILGSPQRETSVRQLIDRVAKTIANWGRAGRYFASEKDAEIFEEELTFLIVHQHMSFNSPVWFNVGVAGVPQQASACFILSVDDEMESILEWFQTEGRIFKGGSGSGLNVSTLRSSKEHLSGGGYASGPVSFMRGADSVAGSIKSGGTTRRAAKMVILNADHPDVREFIWCKAKEEQKAWALGEQGYDMSLNGEAWQSIQFQNANNSVRATHEFMQAALEDRDWDLRGVKTGEALETTKARALLREIAEATWACGDPGMQFDSTINEWHTIPASGRINGSNPCFPADVRVHTTLGLVPIGELYERASRGEEFRVYTHRSTAETPGEGVVATTPIAVMRNGVSPIVRLRFSNGSELRCTPNHRIWTLDRGYVRGDELASSDRVMLNDSPTPATDASWELPVKVEALAVSGHRGGARVAQKLPERWTEWLGELTGHLVGDGWMTDVQTGWVYGADDITNGLLDWHEDLLTNYLGGVSRARMANGTVQLRAGSEAVREFFRGVGVSTDKAPYKRVPKAIFTAPSEVQAAFLRGLYGADGCVSISQRFKGSRYVGLGSASELLLRDVQQLLNAFGVRSRIYRTRRATPGLPYTRKDGTTVEYASHQLFDLRITGTDVKRFAESISFSSPRKAAQLEAWLAEFGSYESQPATRLVSREFDGQGVVYNLTEPLHHSYLVNGLVVANCSEYMSTDDSACNLASLNVMKFLDATDEFDADRFAHAVDLTITAQEILVGNASYPTAKIERNAKAQRQLGLGYANLGALLMQRGLPYDSDAGRAYAAGITALMTGEAYAQSARIAANGEVGPFEDYPKNRDAMLRVIGKHREAAYAIPDALAPAPLLAAARQAWDDALTLGGVYGYRNAQATVLAPTGTISFMMDCDTTGVEPDIALVKYKKLVGGGTLKLVNQTVPAALQRLAYTATQIDTISAFITAQGTIEGAPELRDEHLAVFDCAFRPQNGARSIQHLGHIKMMGAVQPFISGAISKTVNLPEEATVEDVMDAYVESWRHGVKAIAVYRDGSKKTQPLSTTSANANEKKKETVYVEVSKPTRRRLADTRASLTHKFSIEGHECYITVGLFEDGTPGELFISMAKEGSTLSGMLDAYARSVSLLLQYGAPLSHLVEKFAHMRFEPSGWTGNPEIGMAKSIVDYVFRWLGLRFLPDDEKAFLGLVRETTAVADAGAQQALLDIATRHVEKTNGHLSNGFTAVGPSTSLAAAQPERRYNSTPDAPPCSNCGFLMIRNGSCHKCENCGSTSGCS